MSSSSGSPGREVARRLFASEFNDIGYVFTESDDDMAPNYLSTARESRPEAVGRGAGVNRVSCVSVLRNH
jgi:RPA family protein